VRKNRVAVMFTDAELKKLQALARKQRIPIATVAYRLIEKSLERA
jgi:alanine-alpha-ketoisovalerate/valine-pyruvate aminotransferase